MLLLHLVLLNIGIAACGLVVMAVLVLIANNALDRVLEHLDSKEHE